MAEKLLKKGVDRKAKTTGEVGLVEAHLVSVRMANSIIAVRDPNPDLLRELKPTHNSTLIFPFQNAMNTLSFIGS